MNIRQIVAREIFDCRGLPTIQCQLILDNDRDVVSSVPSGISTGSHEAIQRRDNKKRFDGHGVQDAVRIINEIIAPALVGSEPDIIALDQRMLEMDGTDDKSRFGANTMLAVSCAVARASAVAQELYLYELFASLCTSETVRLPFPLFNMIGGGAHASNNLQIQEFLVIPTGATSFRESMEHGAHFSHALADVLKKNYIDPIVGLEGGYTPHLEHETVAFDLLSETIERIDGKNMFKIALDVAATQFYDQNTDTYNWHGEQYSSDDMIKMYQEWVSTYPVVSIEDGLHEDDWQGWSDMRALFDEAQLVGDDLFATNPSRIWHGAQLNAADAVIIKPNQIGTITETLQAIELCHEHALSVIVSHRSGETTDSFIADLAVGASAHQFKAGGCNRGERLVKYNRLLAIEDQLMIRALESE